MGKSSTASRSGARRPKSTFSSGGSGDCVEVALSWRKSTYSSGSGDDCVEIATCPSTIHIRDSKNTQGPHLTLSPTAWAGFITHAAARS
ncbi:MULTISPECIES: DUF397 domain-containing protein [Streptomyces]|uniref:DUF397 domain-containing protein n=1 Tax=Streptomyces TaxID=1883 RepID=UPI0009930538|nr:MULTISPECIES: DUF397 domain-containing protein [Streptomyces]MYT01322.1 DUF397 domain-containing protein [Streptomyces sp. SID5469]OOV31083.1 DUF397 domain-containing protein [Streptomyces avermitilis]